MKFADWIEARAWRVALLCTFPLWGPLGCAGVGSLLRGDDDQPTRVVCTAHYTPVLPNVAVGADSCGNRWLWQDGHCWYFVREQGIVVEIECPAEGDTTYAEP
jgi:hypothetical protein